MSEVIVVTSGKGGVGKTTTTANIGMGLAARGKKVVLVDTDTGLRNLDLLLGLERRIVYTLVDVIQQRVGYRQALVRHKKYENLYLLATSQVADKTAITPSQMAELVKNMRDDFDYILIDCPAGIEQGFQTAVVGADWAIVVTMPEVAAVRDADKIIGKLLADEKKVKLVVNRIRPEIVARGDMLTMEDIDDTLGVERIGHIPDDATVIDAANIGVPVVENENSQAGKAYRNLVGRIMGETIPFMEFSGPSFFDRLKALFGR